MLIKNKNNIPDGIANIIALIIMSSSFSISVQIELILKYHYNHQLYSFI